MATRRARKPASGAAPHRNGFRDARAGLFLERYSLLLAIVFVAIASARIVSTYLALSVTVDEPGHFACGLEYLQEHAYRFETQHPPLARAAAAIGPYLDGTRLLGGGQRDQEGRQILLASPHRDRTVFLMRLGILPFFWLACGCLYGWCRRDFGRPLAATAVLLFTLIPPVLAHAGLATTDMALSAFVIAAFFALLLWVDSPTWQRSAALGTTGAFAALSKFTALGYLPASAIAFGILYLIAKGPSTKEIAQFLKQHAAPLGIAAAVGAVVAWAAYWFSFGPVPNSRWTLPAPEFFDGIAEAFAHNRNGHNAYLLGERSSTGWWYFFPVALGVKTPLALLLLSLAGAGLCVRRIQRPIHAAPLALLLGILVPAMSSNVNIGVRHILPAFAALSILGAVGLAHLAQRVPASPAGLAAVAALPLWICVSGAMQHPDYLAYFNEFVPSEPEKVLIDSDLDWGQELRRLSTRLKELHVTEYSCNFARNSMLSVELSGLPDCTPLDIWKPAEGWNVVDPFAAGFTPLDRPLTGTDLKILARAQRLRVPWYERVAPTERIGCLRLYRIPAGFHLSEE